MQPKFSFQFLLRSFIVCFFLTQAQQTTAATIQIQSIEGFIHSGGNPVPIVTFNTGSLGYTSELDANNLGGFSFTWTNTTGSQLQDLTFTLFIDPDIDRDDNTFFNEYGEFVSFDAPILSPLTATPFSAWEIDEPEYSFGNIYTNSNNGQLDGLIGVPSSAPDDVSHALQFFFPLVAQGDTLNIYGTLSLTDAAGLAQFDPDSGASLYINGYGVLDSAAPVNPVPEPSTLWPVALAFSALTLRKAKKSVLRRARYSVLLLPAIWLYSQASADLRVTSISPTLTTDSQTLVTTGSLSVVIGNAGAASAPAGFTVLAFEDRNGNSTYESGTDLLLGSTNSPAPVNPSASISLNIPISGTLQFAGNLIHVLADSSSVVAESNESNNIRHTGQTSVFPLPPLSNLQPGLLWIRDTFAELQSSRAVTNTPVVGDINGDSIPDVAFTTYDPATGEFANGVLRVISGDTGNVLLSVTDPTLRVHPGASIALADIDNDNRAEIVTADENCRLIAFEHDGSFKWRGTVPVGGNPANTNCWVAPAIADLNRDGSPEIVVGNIAFAANGAHLWTGTGATGGFADTARVSVIADLDLDGNLEVIAGPTAYRADGSIYWNQSALSGMGDGFAAIGNFDADPFPEIVIRPNLSFTVFLLEHDGTVKWQVTPANQAVRGGPPVIGDFDNDGQPEIGIADRDRYIVHETDGSVKWSLPIIDPSSGITGSSLFDLNGDGGTEVLFADESFFYIVRGTDGSVLHQFPRSSGTAIELPTVADVDADGHVDIIVPAAPSSSGSNYGVRVYRGLGQNWANARRVWNQHSYSYTNITDDLKVPLNVTPNWLTPGLNNFRTNAFAQSFASPNSAPDLVPSLLRRSDSAFPAQTEFIARVGNGGAIAAAPVRVEFRNGPGGPLLASANTSRILNPGEYEDVKAAWPNPVAGPLSLVVTVDTNQAVLEGNETNNTAAAQLIIGLGPQTTVDDLIPRFKDGGSDLKWTPLPSAVSYNIYRRTATTGSTSIRNGLVTSLGAFSDQGLTNGTTYFYNVRAVNAQGQESPIGTEASTTPIPRTQRGDTPPTITSAPLTRGKTGVLFAYRPVATDPDPGEVLTWSLTGTPQGMTIQSSTGAIQWTPGAAQGGTYRLLLRVTDSRNRSCSQEFNLFIETQQINTPPTITSTAPTQAILGRQYTYQLRAVDPDASDVLSFQALSVPPNFNIQSTTGLATWTPTATGTFPVSLRVTDLAGATATQSFSVLVQNQNRGPVITSTAPVTARLLQTYSYNPTASDPDPGDQLTWALRANPQGMTINPNTGVILWTPTAQQAGSHPVRIEVRDAIGAIATQNWTIQASPVLNLPPTITSVAPTTAQIGGIFSYQVLATDPENDSLAYFLSVFPTGMSISGTGRILWTPASNQSGPHPVTLRVEDPFGNIVTQSFTVTVSGSDTTPPTVTIHTPATNADLTSDTSISISVNDANLRDWTLEYQPTGDSVWTRLASGTTNVANFTAATLPVTLLADNPYRIRLSASDQTQAAATAIEVKVATGEYKPGAFTLSFEDMRFPAPSLPITIQRLYDSTKPYLNDFGRGWQLNYGSIDLRVDAGYNVFVTLPNGRRAKFQFAPIQANPLFPTLDNQYVAPQGSGDSITNLDCSQFLGGAQGLVCLTNLQPYNPVNFRLQTREGFTYRIESGKLREIQDRAGNKTTITPNGITSWTGRSMVFLRDSQGRITQITDSRGSRMRYSYDSSGRLITVEDQMGRITNLTYWNNTHYLSELRTPNNCTGLRQEFDSSGRLTASIDASGRRTEFTYNLLTRTRTVTLEGVLIMTEVTDANGNIISQTNGTGATTQYQYNAAKQLIQTTLPSGRRVAYTYDANGNLLTESNIPPAGPALTSTYQYNAFNLVERIQRPEGDLILYFYDANGNLLRREVRNAANQLIEQESSTWDSLSRRTSRTDGQGVTTTYTYNAFSDQISERLPSGATTNLIFDAAGNPVTYFDALGARTDLDYDATNKLIALRQNGLTLSRYTWNEFGKMASATDGLNQTTTYQYNCSGELTNIVNPLGHTHQYTYTSRGNPQALIDALNRSTSYGYDATGRQISKTTPEGGVTSNQWSPDSLVSRIQRPNGQSIQMTYDGYGRLSTETRPDRTNTFVFNNNSAMTSASEVSGPFTKTTTMSWNAANRLVSSTQPGNRQVTVAYNLAGRRTSLTSPDGTVTNYTYDTDGRLFEVNTGGRWTRFTYDPSGRRTQLLHSNGSRVNYTYNSRGHMTSLTVRDGAANIIRSWNITYDAAGRRTSAILNDGIITWTYDSLNRLTSETIGSASLGNRARSWTYDAVGNRLNAAATYGLDHRLLQNAAFVFGYDANGNQTSINGDTRTYDVMNHATTFGYTFDFAGRRVQRFDVDYVYDERRIVETYSFGAPLDRFTMHPDTDEPLQVTRGGVTHFYLPGLMQSICALTDSTGAVAHRYGYDAWGELIEDTGIFSFLSAAPRFNPFTYTGAQRDPQTGTYLMQIRQYDPVSGRFVQKDPLDGVPYDPASQHPYIYAKNNPLTFADPSGQVALIEYNALITRNNIVKVAAAFVGMAQGFASSTLYFLGDFISRVTPSGFDLVSAWEASAKQTQSYTKSIEDSLAYMDTDNLPVAAGFIDGFQAGKSGGCGVTFPGAASSSYIPSGFGHNPGWQGAMNSGFQPKIGGNGASITPSYALFGLQAGGIGCGFTIGNQWINANAP